MSNDTILYATTNLQEAQVANGYIAMRGADENALFNYSIGAYSDRGSRSSGNMALWVHDNAWSHLDVTFYADT